MDTKALYLDPTLINMIHLQTMKIIELYYDAFNRADMDLFASLLTDNVVHDINQGPREVGKEHFMAFMDRMNQHYREHLADIVVMYSDDGTRAAAEFTVNGSYLMTDAELPDANGQNYSLPAGAFFEIRENKVARVTNYYNLQNWVQQVAGS
jgi:steroid delta-isomerase-like uncharacterized protein